MSDLYHARKDVARNGFFNEPKGHNEFNSVLAEAYWETWWLNNENRLNTAFIKDLHLEAYKAGKAYAESDVFPYWIA